MEEVNYIPGDLVMTDGAPIGTKKGVVYVVTASDPNKTFTLKDGTVNKGVVTLDAVTEEDKAHFVETSTWIKHIVPIPLTQAILEKSGWQNMGEDGDEEGNIKWVKYQSTRNPCISLDYYPNKEDDKSDICMVVPSMYGESLLMEVDYVHDLQHLLFGLGLDSSLKV